MQIDGERHDCWRRETDPVGHFLLPRRKVLQHSGSSRVGSEDFEIPPSGHRTSDRRMTAWPSDRQSRPGRSHDMKAASVTTDFDPVLTADQINTQLFRLLNKIQTRLQSDMKVNQQGFPPASRPFQSPARELATLGVRSPRQESEGRRTARSAWRGLTALRSPLEFGVDQPGQDLLLPQA